MFSVVLPDSSEVRLVTQVSLVLMWVNNVVLRQEFWYDFASSIPLLFELFSSFLGGSVKSKDQWLFLISMSERVKIFVDII